MTYEDCLDKAWEAFTAGLIEKHQIEDYAKHLYEKSNR